MGARDLVYRAYERRLAASLDRERIPRHVGVILDGNRRWARDTGASTAHGHQAGADKIEELLGWCDELGVEVVTLWLLSNDNLARPDSELLPLLRIIESTVGALVESAAAANRRINPVGALDLLPESTALALKAAAEATAANTGLMVNVAVGYGGRREIADAVRSLLTEHSDARHVARRPGAGHHRRAHRRAPLHPRAARPRPGHPHLGRAAAERLPALAERALGVLLLRGLLAGLPPGGLPAGDPGVRRPSPPLRVLSRGAPPESPPSSAWRGDPRRHAPYLRPQRTAPSDRIRKRRESGGLLDEHEAAQRERRRPRRPPDVRPRHQRPARRPAGADPLRRARGRAAGRGHHRARGQAPPSRARLLRPQRAAPAGRPAHRARPPRRAAGAGPPRRHSARGAEPHRPHRAARGLPARGQRHPHPGGGQQPGRRRVRRHPGQQGPADAGQGQRRRAGRRGVPRRARRRVGLDRDDRARGRHRRARPAVPRGAA